LTTENRVSANVLLLLIQLLIQLLVLLLVLLLALLPVLVFAASSPVVQQPHIKVSLISDVDKVRTGDTFFVGLYFQPQEHWHLYWKNPGDSGMPPQVNWQLNTGISNGHIQWPAPQKIPVSSLLNYGYANELVLPVEFKVERNFSEKNVDIKADVSWLVCKEKPRHFRSPEAPRQDPLGSLA
jgi:DsbC/DsbD-like thiol-disulfide interchange protein